MKRQNKPELRGVLFCDNKVRLRFVYSPEAWAFDMWLDKSEWEAFKARVDNAFSKPPELDYVR